MEQCLSNTLDCPAALSSGEIDSMRVGDIGGRGRIYDKDGRLILLQGEIILKEVHDDNLIAVKGKGRIFRKRLIGATKERGTTYLTNRRLVFIRKPDAWLRFKTYGTPLGMGTAAAEALKARDILKFEAMEFLEVYYSEVKSFKSRGSKWADLFLMDDDGIPVRVMLDRRDRNDDKLLLLEQLLLEEGAKRVS